MIVRQNKALNGIEIVFPASPGREIIAELQAQGFRWHPRGKYWWAKRTIERQKFAEKLKGGYHNV